MSIIDNLFFKNNEHEERLLDLIEKDNTFERDVDRLSMFYLVSCDNDIYRKFIEYKLYDFKEHTIIPKNYTWNFLSSSQEKILFLGYNLFNSHSPGDTIKDVNKKEIANRMLEPINLFTSLDRDNFEVIMNAIKLRCR